MTDPETLSEEEIAQFAKQLRALRDALLETSASGTETVELDQSRQGRLSRMDALQAQAMSVETARRREQTLARIAAALRRIEEGEYGWCSDCGEPIARRRLKIDPAAPQCIACAEASEQRR